MLMVGSLVVHLGCRVAQSLNPFEPQTVALLPLRSAAPRAGKEEGRAEGGTGSSPLVGLELLVGLMHGRQLR